jgi:hypothetical protein
LSLFRQKQQQQDMTRSTTPKPINHSMETRKSGTAVNVTDCMWKGGVAQNMRRIKHVRAIL